MEIAILRLNLLSPLYCIPEKAGPFDYKEGSGEKIFCFELEEGFYLQFEPDNKKLLGNLIFGGAAGEVPHITAGAGEDFFSLPIGNYLFAQQREILCKEEIITMAVEIQSEALWQKLLPGNRLYLRYLFEDGKGVTQIFRPYTEN
jgi:hypothetical protein